MGSYASNVKSGGGSSTKNQEKKLGEIWERFKGFLIIAVDTLADPKMSRTLG